MNVTDYLERADEKSKNEFSRGGTTTNIVNYEELANILNDRMKSRTGGANRRLAIMMGMLTNDKDHPIKANIPDRDRSMFSQEKYKFFLEAPFEISNKCCDVMKKNPVHDYSKKTGRKPITAQMASESRLRTQKWLENGCNGFDLKYPISNPMSFWTEQDVLLYIRINNIKICPIYGEVLTEDEVNGQMTIGEFLKLGTAELFDLERPLMVTTGCKRTGCMFCGFGCHLEKDGDGRFERLKQTHPKQYEYIMRPWESEITLINPDTMKEETVTVQGLNYKEVIDWINEHGNLNIKY